MQRFEATALNRVWLADISYIPTGEGWLYLAAVLDLATRKIVGLAMRDHMRTELTLAGLMTAVQRSNRYAGSCITPIADLNVSPGFVSTNSPRPARTPRWAALIHQCRWATHAEARQALFGYIEGYRNGHRMCSVLGYLTPEQAKQCMAG